MFETKKLSVMLASGDENKFEVLTWHFCDERALYDTVVHSMTLQMYHNYDYELVPCHNELFVRHFCVVL